MQTMPIVEATHRGAGEIMEETGLLHKMNASNVGALVIGLVIALRQVVDEVGVVLHSPHILVTVVVVVVVEIASEENVIVSLMTAMMEAVLGIGTALRAEIPNILAVIAMLATGTPLVIALQATGMVVVQIVILRTVSTKIEAMTGMLAHEEVVIGMEVEGRHVMRIGATEAGLVLMTAQAGEAARLHLSAIEHLGSALRLSCLWSCLGYMPDCRCPAYLHVGCFSCDN